MLAACVSASQPAPRRRFPGGGVRNGSIITFAVRKNSEAHRHLSASFAVSAAKFFGLMPAENRHGTTNFRIAGADR